jgi:hypothetical protein
MDYADLISSKVARLPVDRQAEVLRYGYGVYHRILQVASSFPKG